LLADIFENFCENCVMSASILRIITPCLWDAMLKHTHMKFELLTDIDMIIFIEYGIRVTSVNVQTDTRRLIISTCVHTSESSYLMYYVCIIL